MKKILVIVALLLFVGCKKSSQPIEITVFHAGSLSKPFKSMKAEFEKEFPNTIVLLEAGGSRACARKITDQKRRADVMGSADESVIRTLLMPDYADYSINFVTNEMVIMYTEKSKKKGMINSTNWPDILMSEGVEYGHSEPEKDPCGYRTLLVWQLAEKFYDRKDLYKKLRDSMPKKNIRAKETDLIAMLDAGELDYIFIYKSVAAQHHYPFMELPAEINLGNSSHRDFYKNNASVELVGKKPGDKIVKYGAPMVYGITVPKNAKNKRYGEKFVRFILGTKGRKIMEKNGHPVINPAESLQHEKLPNILKPFVKSITK